MTDNFKDIIIPSVINNDMIIKAINDQKSSDKTDRTLQTDQTIEDVNSLRLEYLNILHIDYLWLLTGLTKLSLSNNMIEKIENLDSLINLKELDLSFNEITKIENLDELINLEVLTLYSNKITNIINLNFLNKIHVFSIGRNRIENPESIFHLRKLKELKSLNMAENYCTFEEDFRKFVAAFLPQLTYYEYKRITDEEREKGEEMFADRLKEVLEIEKHEKQNQEIKKQRLEQMKRNEESFVEYLEEDEFFQTLYENDPDGRILILLPEIKDCYQHFKTKFNEISENLFKYGLEQFQVRKLEVDQFFNCVNSAKNKSLNSSRNIMNDFVKEKISISKKVRETQDETNYSTIINKLSEQFHERAFKTWTELMAIEMTLFEQIEELIQFFETNLSEIVTNFIEKSRAFFAEFRQIENEYHKNISTIVTNLVNVYKSSEMKIEENKIKDLFEDETLLNNVINTSNDIHLQIIDVRETRLVTRIEEWLENMIKNLMRSEIQRNRNRVLEINHYLDIQKEEFEDVCQDRSFMEEEEEFF